MLPARSSVEQTDPPRSPREMPTMYDLPSEDPKEPGKPDEYHYLQPQLLSATFRPTNYSSDQLFSVGDMNLYYDIHHANWYKRPDWFAAVGIPRLYDQRDMRLSYVVWQEGVNPFVVVELLSPGTEHEDLGKTERDVDQPPRKWEVYEQILRVPYYILFDRYTDQLKAFGLIKARYEELDIPNQRVWMPGLNLGLGVWQGEYQGIDRQWLRWCDTEGNWISTDAEQEQQRAEQAEARAEQEQRRAEQAEARAEQLAQRLRDLGIEP